MEYSWKIPHFKIYDVQNDFRIQTFIDDSRIFPWIFFLLAPGARAGRLAKGPRGPRSRWPKRLGKIWASWVFQKILWENPSEISGLSNDGKMWENMGEIAIDCC